MNRKQLRHLHMGMAPGTAMPSAGQLWRQLKQSFRNLPAVVRWIIVVEVIAYVLMLVAGESDWGSKLINVAGLTPPLLFKGWVWQALTYNVFHFRQDFFPFLVDVALIWSLGGLFARRWRPKHFLFFFVTSGIVGALSHAGLAYLFPGRFAHTVMGSGASVFALFTAYHLVFGRQLVNFFGGKPFEARWLFYALVGLSAVFFLAGGNAIFGAELGGLLAGWLMVTGRWRPGKMQSWLSKLQQRKGPYRGRRSRSDFRVFDGGKQH